MELDFTPFLRMGIAVRSDYIHQTYPADRRMKKLDFQMALWGNGEEASFMPFYKCHKSYVMRNITL